MNKLIKITLITLLVCGITVAQDQLSTENKRVITDFIEKLDNESYLLKCNNGVDDAFLIYKYEKDVIIHISPFTFSSDIFSNSFKKKIEDLGGEAAIFEQVNEETGKTISRITAHQFVISPDNINKLENIILTLLIAIHENTKKDQPLLFFEPTGL